MVFLLWYNLTVFKVSEISWVSVKLLCWKMDLQGICWLFKALFAHFFFIAQILHNWRRAVNSRCNRAYCTLHRVLLSRTTRVARGVFYYYFSLLICHALYWFRINHALYNFTCCKLRLPLGFLTLLLVSPHPLNNNCYYW